MPTLVEELKRAEENEQKQNQLRHASFNLLNNQTYTICSKKPLQKKLMPQSTMATII